MKKTILTLLLAAMSTGTIAQVFECDEPQGAVVGSKEYPKVLPDRYSGAKPLVTVEGKVMRIVWTGPESKGQMLDSAVIQRSPNFITAVSKYSNGEMDDVVIYSVDVKRGYFYIADHQNLNFRSESRAQSFVAKCAIRSQEINK